ncbi:hypothetical protein GQ457_06G030240 [Hibiscus cannabinus]
MDGLCLKPGIHGMAPAISLTGPSECRSHTTQVNAVGRSSVDHRTTLASSSSSSSSTAAVPPQKTAFSRFSFRYPLRSLWPGGGGGNNKRYNGMAVDDTVLVENNHGEAGKVQKEDVDGGTTSDGRDENWVLKILRVKSLQKGSEEEEEETGEENNGNSVVNGDEEICEFCRVDADADDDENEKKEIEIDKESFSKMLRRVSLAEAKLYAQLSYLGNLAYEIQNIKPQNLLKYRGLRMVTSSIEKTELGMKTEENIEKFGVSSENQESQSDNAEGQEKKNLGSQIGASAASYLHSHTMTILPFKSSNPENSEGSSKDGSGNEGISDVINSDVASLMATTDSVTSVVAAKEEVKQAVADDLNSTHSSPCEWFICDDDQSSTRFFVIQGSETLASWQANLLFEPVQFEGLDVLVHRGIYEAAKGMYEQMLPHVRSHLKSHGKRAAFRFTGHSLGGSLSLLINLMLLIRGEVSASSLLPVVTFGSPSIMCGGDSLLRKLGLPRSHVQAITMHRDIVPRAFSCNYPNHVVELLKAINGNFRHLPCLENQKLLYAPMGQIMILQPDEKFSPHHHLLPSGTGLYCLSGQLSDNDNEEKLLWAAQRVFFNSPHPLEILSDPSAYGSEGTIQRDHDMNSYLKCVRGVIRQELKRTRKTRREQQRRKVWWPLLFPLEKNGGGGRSRATLKAGQEQFNFAGVVHTGRESLKRFTRLVASQHMHLLVVFVFPAKLLLVGAYGLISLR